MRRSSIFMILGLLAAAAPSTAAPAKPHEAWAAGQLERVDASARSVVVRQGTHEMTFVLAADPELTEGKKTLQSGDLDKAVGHQVKVRYIVSAGSKIADRLEVSPAAPAHTSTPPARPQVPPVKK